MLHREVMTESDKSEVIQLEGGHYLHFERQKEIVKKINAWI